MPKFTARLSRRLRRSHPHGSGGGTDTARQIQKLRQRVKALEAEMIETRQQARRIAELTDVVEQLLLPEEARDGRRLEEWPGQVHARE